MQGTLRQRIRHSQIKVCMHHGSSQVCEKVFGTLQKDHEDRIANWFKSLSYYNLARKIIPIPQALKKPDAKAAVCKEWERLEKWPAWQMTKVKSKSSGHPRGTERTKNSPFCHADGHLSSPKIAELEPKYQKYTGRVVLRGDTVKDDSGAYAVFTG